MYSPKISEELITKLYPIAKQKRIPMTRLVNQLLHKTISEMENKIPSDYSLHEINLVSSSHYKEKANSSFKRVGNA
ncbi:MAG: hypothetical protein WC099_00530 [Candidatus Paceibacterota bacterium]